MSRSGEPGARTGRRLGYLFKHAEMRLSELNSQALAPSGIDARELGVLIVIDSYEPASQQQVAQRLGVDRTTMVAILDTLEARGVVSRQPDTTDRRRNLVALTAAGQDVLRRGTAASDGAEQTLLAALSHEEGERLRDLLARVVEPADRAETDYSSGMGRR